MTDDELQFARRVLSEGGVVAVATETYFGFLADARQTTAIDRVFSLKGREASKGVALLLPGREAWASLVTQIPPLAARLADQFWPGPLTIALPARTGIDARLQTEGTVAVRWPGASDASRLAAAFGAPLTATSANLAGRPAPQQAADVEAAFADAVARSELCVVSGRAPGGAPSTVVGIEGGQVKVLRQGQIRESELAGVVPRASFG
ncbi:MAG TPA: L-threonylcarbamoyladenylate synthase [Polyangiaceae bacterium]|jgi:L-threonylcarbamoyladenylate synthase|nr:L-threonylcarbamoyladenylate synthase [Polyangiaceae bacterium]